MAEVAVELTSTKTQLTIGFVKAVENAKEVLVKPIYIYQFALHNRTVTLFDIILTR